jgi:hypothetical protein
MSNTGSKIKHVVSLGSGIVGIAPGTAAFETVDTGSVATTTSCNFFTNKILSPKKIRLKQVVITFWDGVAAGVKFADLVLTTDVGTFSMSPLTNSATASVYELT